MGGVFVVDMIAYPANIGITLNVYQVVDIKLELHFAIWYISTMVAKPVAESSSSGRRRYQMVHMRSCVMCAWWHIQFRLILSHHRLPKKAVGTLCYWYLVTVPLEESYQTWYEYMRIIPISGSTVPNVNGLLLATAPVTSPLYRPDPELPFRQSSGWRLQWTKTL